MKLLKTFLLILFSTLMVGAQVTFQPKKVDSGSEGIIYNREFTFDGKLHTNGYAIGANFGKIKSYYLTTFYHISIGELKHNKEFRQQSFESRFSGAFGGGRSFVFGKRNSFLALRGGYGQKRYFSEKAKKKGLAVGMSYEAGPTLGLLKPYYLTLIYPVDNGTLRENRSEKYSAENADVFLDRSRIVGATGFTKGLGELSIVPGVHAQAAVHFDWGAFDEFVKALEAGIMVDLYFREVPIMVALDNVENSPIFINLFLTLQLGKRH